MMLKVEYQSGKLQKPLTPKHRVFANLSYETQPTNKGGLWKFDATYNWLGEQRFSSTTQSPEAFRLFSVFALIFYFKRSGYQGVFRSV